jgi:hypothetical protein
MKDQDVKLEENESSGCRCYEYFFVFIVTDTRRASGNT